MSPQHWLGAPQAQGEQWAGTGLAAPAMNAFLCSLIIAFLGTKEQAGAGRQSPGTLGHWLPVCAVSSVGFMGSTGALGAARAKSCAFGVSAACCWHSVPPSPRCHLTYIQVVDEGLVGLCKGVAVLAVLDHVKLVGFPEVGELPAVLQHLPQGTVPRQGHPGRTRVLVSPTQTSCSPHGCPEALSTARMQIQSLLPHTPTAALSSRGTAQRGDLFSFRRRQIEGRAGRRAHMPSTDLPGSDGMGRSST